MKKARETTLIGTIGLIPLLSVCGTLLYFYDYVGIEAILVATLASSVFISFGFSVRFLFRVDLKKVKVERVRNFDLNYVDLKIWLTLAVIAIYGTLNLLFLFVENFGFSALYTRPDLFQSNAVVNSFGYLLYINVFVFAGYFKVHPSDSALRVLCFFVFLTSLVGLIFAGNKSYLFQALLLSVLIVSAGRLRILFGGLFWLILVLFGLFALYDQYIDLVEGTSILERPIAYIFGGWATFQKSADAGYISTYVGDYTLYPLYKIITYGKFSEESLFPFYAIKGLELNQFSIFGGAYHDFSYFGVVVVAVMLSLVEYILGLFKLKTRAFVFDVVYWYFITALILSCFFANIFSGLYFYVSLFILIFIHWVYSMRFRVY